MYNIYSLYMDVYCVHFLLVLNYIIHNEGEEAIYAFLMLVKNFNWFHHFLLTWSGGS